MDVAAMTPGNSRHAAGLEETKPPMFKPLREFVKNFKPEKTCSRYILEDCAMAFEALEPGSSAYFETLVEQAACVTESKLQFFQGPSDDDLPACAFAVVCYTMDLRQFGASENFSDLVNRALQKRSPELLQRCAGYFHFLMKGLGFIEPASEKVFYRGIPRDRLDIFQRDYTQGTILHWSDITSVTEKLSVAKEFAGVGGIIISIRARSARPIKQLSAFPGEAEALLLPNWKGIVLEGLTVGAEGFSTLSILELTHEHRREAEGASSFSKTRPY